MHRAKKVFRLAGEKPYIPDKTGFTPCQKRDALMTNHPLTVNTNAADRFFPRWRWRCRRVVFWADARSDLSGPGTEFPCLRFPKANFMRPKRAFFGHFSGSEKT